MQIMRDFGAVGRFLMRVGCRSVLVATAVLPALPRLLGRGTASLSVSAIPPAKCSCDYGSYQVTVSGTYSEFPSEIDVYVHRGTNACPSTDAAENSQVQSQQPRTEARTTPESRSAWSWVTTTAAPGVTGSQFFWGVNSSNGTYWACAYLLGPQQGPFGPAQRSTGGHRFGKDGPADTRGRRQHRPQRMRGALVASGWTRQSSHEKRPGVGSAGCEGGVYRVTRERPRDRTEPSAGGSPTTKRQDKCRGGALSVGDGGSA